MKTGELLEGFLAAMVLFETWREDEGEPEDIEAKKLEADVAAAVKARASDDIRAGIRRYLAYVNARFGGASAVEALALSVPDGPSA